ncbi:MAG TPA: glucose-6-phosphate dehydrogenase assembly protein OpcA, partial [Gemmataceae bacterium]|nr:glucose-6-phosphate dehydrogenase assembly protein OpcA [Gemmataceae bacterium]
EGLACEIESQIPAIVRLHPARVLLLIGQPAKDGGRIEASVCVRQHGGTVGVPVYSEQITLRATGTAADRLPYVVRTLVMGDLPINLWWVVPQAPPLAGALLFDLAEHAEQVIYDSTGWPEPAHGVLAATSWLNRLADEAQRGVWRTASDLNWRRLKAWRRILGQSLDPRTAPGAIGSIAEVLIEHGPHGMMQGWLLAGWLASQLGWRLQQSRVQPGSEVSWSFTTANGTARLRIRRLSSGPSDIRHLRIACQVEHKPVALDMTVQEEQRLAVVPEGLEAAVPRTVSLPTQERPQLLGQQLSDRERNAVFLRSMRLARDMASLAMGMDVRPTE